MKPSEHVQKIKKWKLISRGGGYSNGRVYHVSLPLYFYKKIKFNAHEIGPHFHLGHAHCWTPAEDPDTPLKAQKALKLPGEPNQKQGWLMPAIAETHIHLNCELI
jgi:hypothetical protein